MNLELEGRAFLITGGTDGLGLGLARRLVDEGAMVAVCGRDEERLARAQELLGDGALCQQADVTSSLELDAFLEDALGLFGRLDGVVNNAGRTAGSLIARSDDEDWRRDFDLKVVAALHLSREALEALAATGGSVLNVLAIGARAPDAGSAPSSASRAAGLALTKAMAQEYAPRGVRVNAVLIGLIESGQWVRRAAQANAGLEEFLGGLAREAKVPLGRVGRVEEFADVAAFLLSSRASYVTGVGVAVDGGLSPVI